MTAFAKEIGDIPHRVDREQCRDGRLFLVPVNGVAGHADDRTASPRREVPPEIPVHPGARATAGGGIGQGERRHERRQDLEREILAHDLGGIAAQGVVAGAVLLAKTELAPRGVTPQADLADVGSQKGPVAVVVGVVASNALHVLAGQVGQADLLAEQTLVSRQIVAVGPGVKGGPARVHEGADDRRPVVAGEAGDARGAIGAFENRRNRGEEPLVRGRGREVAAGAALLEQRTLCHIVALGDQVVRTALDRRARLTPRDHNKEQAAQKGPGARRASAEE